MTCMYKLARVSRKRRDGRQAIGRKETFPEPRRRTGPQQPRHKSLIGSQQILVDLPALETDFLKGLTKRRPAKLGFSHLSREKDSGEREKPRRPANPETAR